MRLSRLTDNKRSFRVLLAASATALVAGLLTAIAPVPAQAAELPPSIVDGGYIIGDEEFFDGTAMSANQVQAFLESRVRTCRATSGPTCLKDFRTTLPSISADRYCGAIQGGTNLRASDVIARVGAACDVNPKVILVMLQKEQGLVTATAPTAWSYRAAMGQMCPDDAPCDAAAAGFVNQVRLGARQQQIYVQNPQWFRYKAGQTNTIQWSPDASCGTSQVYIRNQATANLYNYTPYRPNIAALAAGYGTGDRCSTYGNRNFYNYYVDWFAPGASASSGAPAQVAACTVPTDADIVPRGGRATVASGPLNARSAPTTACGAAQTLATGATVEITGTYGSWTRATTEGRTVWLASSYLDLSGAGTPAPATGPCTVPSGVQEASGEVVVSTDVLNARQAPNTSCSTGVVQFRKGQTGTRTGTHGDWWRVSVSGKAYWMHSDYLEVEQAPAPTPPPAPEPTPAVTTDALNLRSGPALTAPVLTVLARGTAVSVTEQSGAWRKASVGGRTGWVHGDYLSAPGAAPKPTTATTTEALNLRSGPALTAAVQTVLARGTTVTITGSSGAWRSVTAGSRSGWVHGDYLTASATPQPVTKSTTDAVNLRSAPSLTAGVQTVVPRGTRVTVTGSNGVWQQVSVGGRTGWMHGDWLR